MKKILSSALLAALAPLSAHAATFSSVSGDTVGAAATFNFNTATPQYSGTIFTDSVFSSRAAPLGDTTPYFAVGPSDGQTSALLDLSAFGNISSFSLYWGSMDDYNFIELVGLGLTFSGNDISAAFSDGGQTDPMQNRTVTFNLTGAEQGLLTGLRFSSTQNAFEGDNVNIVATAVPEPATWAMMLGGLGLIGLSMRRRNRYTIAHA